MTTVFSLVEQKIIVPPSSIQSNASETRHITSNKNSGFSLVELMIVVAIIGVLTLIAFPAYRGYIIRVELTQIASMLGHYMRTYNTDLMAADQYPSMGVYDLMPQASLPGVNVSYSCLAHSPLIRPQLAEVWINSGLSGGPAFTPEAQALMANVVGAYYPYMSYANFRDTGGPCKVSGATGLGYIGVRIGLDMQKMSIPGIRDLGSFSGYTMELAAFNFYKYKIIDLYTNEVVEDYEGRYDDLHTWRPLCLVTLPSQQSIAVIKTYIPKPCRLYQLSSYTYLRF